VITAKPSAGRRDHRADSTPFGRPRRACGKLAPAAVPWHASSHGEANHPHRAHRAARARDPRALPTRQDPVGPAAEPRSADAAAGRGRAGRGRPVPSPAAVEPAASASAPAAPPPAPPEPEGFRPDLAALTGVASRALGFAAAVLAELPAPTDLVHRDPSAAEPPPGPAPRGDARSLRSDGQFALIYRAGSALVSRRGKLGEHGAWRVVEYPTAAQAAHAYAAECSRLQAQGFRDVV
jgi:hypothetical protein